MKKFITIILFSFSILLFCTSCKSHTKETANITKKEVSKEDKEITNKCKKLTNEKAKEIAKEIKEIYTITFKNVYKIDTYSFLFKNDKEKNGKRIFDVNVTSRWTFLQKVEDEPLIVGMRKAQKTLKKEKEKKNAEAFISVILAERKAEHDRKTISDYNEFKVIMDDETGTFTIKTSAYGEDKLYPLKEYYYENYKEDYNNNYEKQVEIGRKTLLERARYD